MTRSYLQNRLTAEIQWRTDPIDPRSIKPVVVDAQGRERVAIWAAQPGSQQLFLSCPIPEILYEGTRGPGKTDALLMKFYQYCGRRYGSEWKGVIFRRTYPELVDIIEKSKKWFHQICPGAVYNESKTMWRFPGGEILYFRQFEKPDDYWKYHGHAYPFIGWEELCNWPDYKCYKSMFSCSRSTVPGIPIMVCATTNPYGVGHNWVKLRWRLPIPPGKVCGAVIRDSLDEDGKVEPPRVAIHGNIHENKILLQADPSYIQRIGAAARNPAEKRAWLYGDWDIVAGGMFDDIWFDCRQFCVIQPFEIPSSWIIDRSFDWGSSRPFSVGWWAISDGTDVKLRNGKVMSTVRGDLFRINEWYGWNGQPNEGIRMLAKEISAGIVHREILWKLHGKVKPGPADSSIFDEENGNCIAKDMEEAVRVNGTLYPGVKWEKADKSPGSRAQGWEQMRKMLKATIKPQGSAREHPGLFVFDNCQQFLRTVPTLPRSNKKLDDVDSEAEDHIGDECRYRIRFERKVARSGSTIGGY